jgi:hypothetical protein
VSLNPEARRGDVPNHSDAEVLVELYGPDNDGWYSSRILDWIGLSDDLRDPDTRGYLVLRALVYEKYKKPVRNLTLSLLCELIPGPNGKASSQGRVRGILKALSDVGLVSTLEGGPVKTSSRASAAGKPLRIRINDMPKEGYLGWRNAEAKLKWLQAGKPFMEAGQNSDPVPDPDEGETEAGQNSDPRGSNSDPDSGSDLRKREHPLVPSIGASDAPSGRSPVDGRSPSTSGSSAREAEGGSAASGKTSPSPTPNNDTDRPTRGQKSGSKAKHTREQLALVAAVRAHFPAEFLGGLPDVPTLSQAILDALAGDVPAADRTVEQLGARIQQRWDHHGWASKFYAGEIDSLVGAAVAMVRPLKAGDRYGCANPRCEAGADVDTKEECSTCPERFAARKAERRAWRVGGAAGDVSSDLAAEEAAMPAQRGPAPSWWHCSECEAPGKGESPADGVCANCRTNLQKSGQSLTPPF